MSFLASSSSTQNRSNSHLSSQSSKSSQQFNAERLLGLLPLPDMPRPPSTANDARRLTHWVASSIRPTFSQPLPLPPKNHSAESALVVRLNPQTTSTHLNQSPAPSASGSLLNDTSFISTPLARVGASSTSTGLARAFNTYQSRAPLVSSSSAPGAQSQMVSTMAVIDPLPLPRPVLSIPQFTQSAPSLSRTATSVACPAMPQPATAVALPATPQSTAAQPPSDGRFANSAFGTDSSSPPREPQTDSNRMMTLNDINKLADLLSVDVRVMQRVIRLIGTTFVPKFIVEDALNYKLSAPRHKALKTPIYDVILSKYNMHLGAAGRRQLKSTLSWRVAGDRRLHRHLAKQIAPLKHASVQQLLQIAEVVDCLDVALLNVSIGQHRPLPVSEQSQLTRLPLPYGMALPASPSTDADGRCAGGELQSGSQNCSVSQSLSAVTVPSSASPLLVPEPSSPSQSVPAAQPRKRVEQKSDGLTSYRTSAATGSSRSRSYNATKWLAVLADDSDDQSFIASSSSFDEDDEDLSSSSGDGKMLTLPAHRSGPRRIPTVAQTEGSTRCCPLVRSPQMGKAGAGREPLVRAEHATQDEFRVGAKAGNRSSAGVAGYAKKRCAAGVPSPSGSGGKTAKARRKQSPGSNSSGKRSAKRTVVDDDFDQQFAEVGRVFVFQEGCQHDYIGPLLV